jgi:predicted Zn-dependent protease
MDPIPESCRLHNLAWQAGEDYEARLLEALAILQRAYDGGDSRHLVINNYAAVLLDLQRNQEALDLLKKYQPESSAFCANYAIAIAKTLYRIQDIRRWNTEAKNYPAMENAIEAYIDWQGF